MTRKRAIVLGTLFVMMVAVPLRTNAQDSMEKVGEGYTSDGVYYEVFAVEDLGEDFGTLSGTQINVTRQVIFAGSAKAPMEYYWKERIEGSYYSGTLTLQSSMSDSNQTIATYAGILYKE